MLVNQSYKRIIIISIKTIVTFVFMLSLKDNKEVNWYTPAIYLEAKVGIVLNQEANIYVGIIRYYDQIIKMQTPQFNSFDFPVSHKFTYRKKKKRLGLMAAIHRYLPFLFLVADIPTHQLSVAHPLTDRNISFGNTLELNDQMANSWKRNSPRCSAHASYTEES